MEIVDTVYLIAYLLVEDKLHEEATKIIDRLSENRKVSQASLLELDLLMKSRKFNFEEKTKAWSLLDKVIPVNFIEIITPQDFLVASALTRDQKLDYFDALVAAQCTNRSAKPLTTDKKIIDAVKKV
ncbi:MAG: PIN domain-containing protein [Thermoproteota archaeon]|nr:PIN domain-containing protein [Candidatus Brockarchaeota archaeon]